MTKILFFKESFNPWELTYFNYTSVIHTYTHTIELLGARSVVSMYYDLNTFKILFSNYINLSI